jgi:hypothetical protein
LKDLKDLKDLGFGIWDYLLAVDAACGGWDLDNAI